MLRGLLVTAGVLGAAAVALGAYAAHGLEGALAERGYEGAELADRVDNFVTGARYQLATAVAVLALAIGSKGRPLLAGAGWTMAGGVVVFSGLLYALAFAGDDWRWLGAVVPLGGLAMIVGWGMIAAAGFVRAADDAPKEEATPVETGLIRLEEVISHQERLLQDLNEAVTETRRDAEPVAPKLRALEETVRRLVELQQGAEDSPDERPPHY